MAVLDKSQYDSVDELGEDETFVLRQLSLGLAQAAIGQELQKKTDRDSKVPLDKILDDIVEKFSLREIPSREKQLKVAAKRYVDYSVMNEEGVEPVENGADVQSSGAGISSNGSGGSPPPVADTVSRRLGATSIWASLPNGEWQQVLARVGKAIAAGKYVTVDPFKIRPMKGQPREYFPADEQRSLGESMDLTGQIQDVIIRSVPSVPASDMDPLRIGDRVWRVEETESEVCDGERRWRSALEKNTDLHAKLIEIDDIGARLVSSVANFNRVGHTALEEAKNLKGLLEGEVKFPFEVAIALQGISKTKAERLLDVLKLPADVQDLMHPGLQGAKGEDVLGKAFGYQIARLGGDPVLHEHARTLARRAVKGELKLPQVTMEVDRILSQSGTGRNVLGERNQPARRLKTVGNRLTVVIDNLRNAKLRLTDLSTEGVLPEAAKRLGPDLNNIADMAEEALRIIGVERTGKSESQ